MYSLTIHLYATLIRIAALLGHTKARLMREGHRHLWKHLQNTIRNDSQWIWIHCASAGEFEQARPLMEDIRAEHPQHRILVTFFSPSGYELRKNCTEAHCVSYLPLDTRRNARRFLSLVNPTRAYFIKYEFWRNHLRALHSRNIPVYLVSGIFRSTQIFFRWYGGWYRKLLKTFTHFFVQNEQSAKLLRSAGITCVTVTGDTRFDRVCRIFDRTQQIPEIERFLNGHPCIVAGSTWPPCETLIAHCINRQQHSTKWIIAPHELHENRISRLERSIAAKTVRHSQLAETDPADCRVLIIDNIGMLSALYRYGTAAYIGGGFGKGIHNILEAAVFGIPVLFGPACTKFQEATELIKLGGAFPIKNSTEFETVLNRLLNSPDTAANAGRIAGTYVASGRGATAKVIKGSF